MPVALKSLDNQDCNKRWLQWRHAAETQLGGDLHHLLLISIQGLGRYSHYRSFQLSTIDGTTSVLLIQLWSKVTSALLV